MKTYITFLFVVASVLADSEPKKVIEKRSFVNYHGSHDPYLTHGLILGHGAGINRGHIALPPLSLGYSQLPHDLSGHIVGANIHTTVTKHVGVPVPAPYPVAVDRPVPVPVKVAVPVPVDRPYAVPVPKPYPVAVEKHIPVPVDRPIPVPVPHAVPVPIIKQVGVPVPHPYPVGIPKPVAVPVPAPVPVHVVKSVINSPVTHDLYSNAFRTRFGW